MAALDALTLALARIARALRRLALGAAAAALVIAVYVLRDGLPEGGREWVLAVLVLALAAAPPVVLWLFTEALLALASLPERLRTAPAEGGARVRELTGAVDALRGARGAGVPRLLWRLARTASSSWELLTLHAAVLPLASVPFLLLSAAAAAGAVLEIVAALVLALLLLAG
jgi:hypothetical protein